MGPPSFMRSVVDRNVVMWRTPVHVNARCSLSQRRYLTSGLRDVPNYSFQAKLRAWENNIKGRNSRTSPTPYRPTYGQQAQRRKHCIYCCCVLQYVSRGDMTPYALVIAKRHCFIHEGKVHPKTDRESTGGSGGMALLFP